MSTTFTPEEMASISSLRQEFASVAFRRGELEFQKDTVEREISAVKDAHAALVTKEQEIAKSLSETYGPGTLNAETGEFTPAPTA